MLIAAARDKQAEVRENAVFALGLIGPKVDGVLPIVRAAMGDSDDRVRNRASSALAALDGPEIAGLIASLRGRDPRAQQSAAEALLEMGPKASPAVPALMAHLADDHEGVLSYAMMALSAIGAPAVPALVESLGHVNPRRRLGAAEARGGSACPPHPRATGWRPFEPAIPTPRSAASPRSPWRPYGPLTRRVSTHWPRCSATGISMPIAASTRWPTRSRSTSAAPGRRKRSPLWSRSWHG